MFNNKVTTYLYISVGLVLALLLAYWLELRYWVQLAYHQQAPDWFQSIIQWVYPRFGIEKQRFSLHFFLAKADQVIGRFALVSLGSLFFLFLYRQKNRFRQKINHYWNGHTLRKNAQRQLQVFAALMFLFTWDWYFYLQTLSHARAFYTPVLPFRILGLPFPAEHWLLVFYIVFLLANVALLFRYKVVWASIVSVLLFVLLQGYMYCFHKLDHTYATLTHVALLVPLLAWYEQKSRRQQQAQVPAWVWQLMQVTIVLTYFQAGLEKLLIGGVEWMYPQTFRTYLYLHPTALGNWISGSNFWCTILPLGAMLFQLGFVIIIFYPRLKLFFLPVGILFHLGTFLLFGIGWYYSPWMLTYLFFIEWKK